MARSKYLVCAAVVWLLHGAMDNSHISWHLGGKKAFCSWKCLHRNKSMCGMVEKHWSLRSSENKEAREEWLWWFLKVCLVRFMHIWMKEAIQLKASVLLHIWTLCLSSWSHFWPISVGQQALIYYFRLAVSAAPSVLASSTFDSPLFVLIHYSLY